MDYHYAEPHEVMYHTQLSRALLMGADTALLPGDPGRVRSLAEAMGPTVDLTSHREYTSCLTQVQNQPVLVCSTGMGGPSTAICLEELARLGIRRVIRVGTTGSIQEGLELGDVVIIKAAVRLEGTSSHYAPLEFPAVADFELTQLLAYAALVENVPHQVGICCSSTNNLETSAIRRMFSMRSASVKPKLLLMPLRILSPSKIRQSNPRLCNSRSKAIAIVLLPDPLSPVNQIITLCCFRSSSLSCLDNILSKIGYILFSVIIQSKWPY